MAWKLLVNSVDKTSTIAQPSTPQITLSLNNRGTAKFLVLPGYVPSKYDDVQIYAQDGVTKLFGGIVLKRTGQPFGPNAATTQMAIGVEVTDYQVYGDWCFSTRTYTSAPTLKTVLQDLVTDCLGTYGVTLDAAQVTGPTLTGFTGWSNTKVSDAWRALYTATGYVLRIDANKAMKMFVPGTDAAPFSTTDATPHCMSLDWADSDFQSTNTIILQCGTAGAADFTDSQTATGNGSQTVFTFPAASPITTGLPTHRPYTLDGGGGTIHVGGVVKHETTDYTWTVNQATATSTLTMVVAPGVGVVIDFLRQIQQPFTVIATTGASPPRTTFASDPNVVTVPAAVTEANQMLTTLGGDPRQANCQSLDIGWLPGQLWTINVTTRGINANFTIGDVNIMLVSDSYWVYKFFGNETVNYQGNAVDKWRALLGGSAGSGGSVLATGGTGGAGGGGGTTAPGGSNTDVQFNDSGSFGGDANFTYQKTTHSLTAGLSCAITAASPESCIAMGDGCSVADS